MKLSLMALALGAALAGQAAQACFPPRPAPALPAGLDGKLPTVDFLPITRLLENTMHAS